MNVTRLSYEAAEARLTGFDRALLERLGLSEPVTGLAAYVRARHDREGWTRYGRDDGGLVEAHASPFDTGVFGVPTTVFSAVVAPPLPGALERRSALSGLAAEALGREAAAGSRLLVCRTPLADAAAVQALEDAGFRLMDVQCPLVLDPRRAVPAPAGGPAVRPVRPDDVEPLVRFGRSAFAHGHHYTDPRLPRERADALHEAWVRNDCGGRADTVLVAEEAGPPLGFVACVLDTAAREHLGVVLGHVDLIAVDAEARGRGVGRALMRAALGWFVERGAERVTISTQAVNLPALSLYRGLGFRDVGPEATMHAWVEA